MAAAVVVVTGGETHAEQTESPPAAWRTAGILGLRRLGVGRSDVRVAVIDGPVDLAHPAFATGRVTLVPNSAYLRGAGQGALLHGTLVVGLLAGAETGICPGCTVLVRPLSSAASRTDDREPWASLSELRQALEDVLALDVDVINLSVVAFRSAIAADIDLEEVLSIAAQRKVLIVAALANSVLPSHSPLLKSPWVLPVVACDGRGRLAARSQRALAVRHRAIAAPGQGLPTVQPGGQRALISGTSAAAAVVSGALALLRTHVPAADGAQLRWSVTRSASPGTDRAGPALIDAWVAYRHLRGV